jgi:bifunctional non-homologous end joining protein LigD
MAKHIAVENLLGACKSSPPKFIAPQLATLVKEPPSGDEWLHELTFDGYRMLCHLDRGEVRFWSRNGKDWTSKFPNLTIAARAFPVDTAIIDGEVVILDRDGRSNFQKLQHAIGSGGAAKFCFQAFDLIYLDGLDLIRVTLEDRKRLLKTLFKSIPVSSPLRYSDHIEGNGALFFQHACQTGVEGIVSKLRTSHYDSARSRSWLKVKCTKRQEFVIAGYTDSSKGLPGFGALILGVYEGDRLIYAGRVGTGFSIKQRIDLKRLLDQHSRETSAFSVIPRDPGLREAHWIEPSLVAEVSFIEWTSDGSIRHPSFQGLREDKQPQEVRREMLD